jgi:hypothetical protein
MKAIQKHEIIKRIEYITKHQISNHILLFPNGRNKTCEYYDCETSKYMRCTIKHSYFPSNFREHI